MSHPLAPLDPPPSLSSIEVLRRVDLGDGRRVCAIRLGAIRLGSIFVIDGRVSWPRTARGYEIICIEDAALRERIEAELLQHADRAAEGGQP